MLAKGRCFTEHFIDVHSESHHCLVAPIGGCFSLFTTKIYFLAIDPISKALHVSISGVNLTITTCMILQGIAPSVIPAIMAVDQAYVIGFFVYMSVNVTGEGTKTWA